MPHKEKRLTDAKAAAEEADFRVFQTHHGGSHDTEGFALLHPRLRATRSARAFDLSGRAGGGFYHRFPQNYARIFTKLCAAVWLSR